MRIFPVLLLFCVFSGFCGDLKKSIDISTDCLLSATIHPDSPESLLYLRQFFDEIKAGSFTGNYIKKQKALSVGKYTLGWEELRKRIAGVLTKNKINQAKGKDLALFLMRQWGYTLWRARDYQPPIKLNEDPNMSLEGEPIYPPEWGVVTSDHECGNLFVALLKKHWGDNALINIVLSVVRAMDNQNKKHKQ